MNIKIKRKDGFTLVELLVVISIIAILAGLAFPAINGVLENANQTTAVSNLRQIGLSLVRYANDHDGHFPNEAGNANANLEKLLGSYLETKKLFYVSKSGWTPGSFREANEFAADNDATHTLDANENHWAYVKGLNTTSQPALPLVADGFATGEIGTYTDQRDQPGGVWRGRSAIVLRIDNSVKVERTNASFEVMVQRTGGEVNLFAATNLPATAEVVIPNTPTGGGTAPTD